MRAFDVYLNRKRLCRAGIGGDGVIAAIVDWVKRRGVGDDMSLHVGGLISLQKEHVDWVPRKRLRVGDRIQIRVVETKRVDKPVKRCRIDPQKEIKAQKRYVRMIAKKFGWKIQFRANK